MSNFTVKITEAAGGAVARLEGDLTLAVPGAAWKELSTLPLSRPCVFDLSGLTALDINGAAQVLSFARAQRPEAAIRGLPEHLRPIFELAATPLPPMEKPPPRPGPIEALGRIIGEMKEDAEGLLAFFGELLAELARAFANPRKIHWSSVWGQAEAAGVNAVPIVSLVAFLVGLIIAFQAAMLMKIFGAEILVADLIGIAVVRELGPLITGIVLAGRSGSAFSAELGAMKAAEEVDAIITMGLSPVRELALPRVLAALLTTPPVNLIASFMGIVGGSLVLIAMGYTPGVYWAGAVSQVSLASFFIGLGKALVFGFTLAAVGCQRGLFAGDGPGAVGLATTSGVVANIVLIVVLDSLFAVVFYVLDI